jgi:hypothetical protein
MNMASDAQILANQENAKKSTGPKTVEGKQRSSMNAMTHGIFAQIPILPGEDRELLNAIADGINQTYKPRDAMEVILVERITVASFRQIRLREAEAAHIKINMSEERLLDSVNVALQIPFLERFTFDHLSPEREEYYQIFLKVIGEIKAQVDLYLDFSIEMIESKMPLTFPFLKEKSESFKMTWEEFITRPESIQLAMKEVKEGITKYLEINKFAHSAFHLLEEIKITQRLPKGIDIDMDRFNKYQTQFDTDLYRAMNQLERYRQSKAKIIEGEVIEEVAPA